MDNQNTTNQQPTPARHSDHVGQQSGTAVTQTASVPPEPYNPITLFKREKRDEQIFDIDGTLWNVKEARATKYGFDLLFGRPANSRLGRWGGPKCLIASPPLVAFWELHRTDEGYIYDLPAGRTTIKRLRRRLRLDFFVDRRNLWKKRAKDLKTLPTAEFAERYQVKKEVANSWRYLFSGRATRPLNWWHHPEALAVLRNPDLLRREVAKILNIGTSHAHRLRKLALALDSRSPKQQEIVGPIPNLPYERKPTVPRLPSPFQMGFKQGRMFIGSPFWQRNSPAEQAKKIAALAPPRKGPGGSCKHSHSKAAAKRTRQMLLSFDAPRGPEAKPVLFQIQDFQGTFYDVYDARPTQQGFDLLFGFQTRAHRRLYTDKGKPGLIATPELLAYWKNGGAFDLPAGLTTMVRLRSRFCLGRTRKEKGTN